MRNKRAGFTLVELLVVIGIIAVLIAILLPALSRARQNANRAACLSNIQQLSKAFIMYCNDNQGWFPFPAVYGGPSASAIGYGIQAAPSGYPADWIGWPEDWIVWRNKGPNDVVRGAIAQYLGDPTNGKVLICPSDDGNRAIGVIKDSIYPYSYVLNGYMTSATNSNPHVPGTVTTPKNNLKYPLDEAYKLSQVQRPADKVMVYEADQSALSDGRGQLESPPIGMAAGNIISMLAVRHDTQIKYPDVPPNASMGAPNNTIESQVNASKSGNAGFADGHADYVTRAYASNRAHYDPTDYLGTPTSP